MDLLATVANAAAHLALRIAAGAAPGDWTEAEAALANGSKKESSRAWSGRFTRKAAPGPAASQLQCVFARARR